MWKAHIFRYTSLGRGVLQEHTLMSSHWHSLFRNMIEVGVYEILRADSHGGGIYYCEANHSNIEIMHTFVIVPLSLAQHCSILTFPLQKFL